MLRELMVRVLLSSLPWSCKREPAELPPDPAIQRKKEIEERVLKTRRCEGCIIEGTRLAGVDLRGAKLKGSDLDGNWRGVNLTNADLTEASLGGDFEGADLRGATMKDAWVDNARFRKAHLDGLDLRSIRGAPGADWSEAILRGANLERVGFAGMEGDLKRTPRTHFFSVPVGGASLRGADLRDANLKNAGFERCDLRGADLRGADLDGAVLPSDAADLLGADFSGAMGPWGVRCADVSRDQCVPVGTVKEFRAMRRRQRRSCIEGWPCEFRDHKLAK